MARTSAMASTFPNFASVFGEKAHEKSQYSYERAETAGGNRPASAIGPNGHANQEENKKRDGNPFPVHCLARLLDREADQGLRGRMNHSQDVTVASRR